MYLKIFLLTFAFIVSIFSSTAWSMDGLSDLKEGTVYVVKNYSNHCLYSGKERGTGFEIGRGTMHMDSCGRGDAGHQRLARWYFEKHEGYPGSWLIRNVRSGAYVDAWGHEVGPNSAGLSNGDSHPWRIEKHNDGTYRIKNVANTHCLASSEHHIVTMEECVTNKDAIQKLWRFEEDKLSTCLFIDRPRCNDEKETLRIALAKRDLFFSSAASGAAYSLIPEIIQDGIEFIGYPRTANIAATIIQGGMIAYNTVSYVPTITGMAIRSGFHQLGFSHQTSAIAGSTAAVIASVSQSLLFSQEEVLNSAVNCTIALAGSYAGSYLALQTKSWVYGLWNNSSSASISEKDREIEELKRERNYMH